MNIEQLLKEYESASKYEMIKFLYEERNLNSILNSDKNKLTITIWKKDKEIERLNNIIDELEEVSYLGMIENTANNDMSKGLNIAYEYINNKIQELRGNDNA